VAGRPAFLPGYSIFYSFIAQFLYYNLPTNGKKIRGYGMHRLGVELFAEDWGMLFKLLEERQTKPVIAGRFPLEDIVEANRLLESGQVTGNLVIVPLVKILPMLME
jgi:NADPH:quinone reductase-like Zn-dependent oxidoreductase